MSKIRRNIGHVIVLSYGLLISCGVNKSDHASSDDYNPTAIQAAQLSLREALPASNHLPISERIAVYHERKIEQSDQQNEDVLNLYGYTLLWDDKISEAIEIFELVVAEFPHSSNAYDSLGDGYMASGDMKLSLQNYKKFPC